MSDKISVFKFDGSDFSVWKAQIEALLTARGHAGPLKSLRPRNSTDAAEQAQKLVLQAEWDEHNRQARSLLLLSLDNKHAKLVLQCNTAREIWSRLISLNEQRSASNKIILQKEFFEINMGQDEVIQDYVGRAEYIYGQLKDIGVKSIDESTLVSKIVSGLSKRYLNFISNWSSVETGKETLDNLLPKLMAEEQLLNKFNPKRGESLAYLGESGKKFNKFDRKKRPQHTDRRYEKPQERPQHSKNKTYQHKDKRVNRCWTCNEEGHFKHECPKWKSLKEFYASRDKDKVEAVSMIAESNLSNTSEEWILDSGATEHMSNQLHAFTAYKALDPPKNVRFGDSSVGEGIGVGDIMAESQIGGGKNRMVILRNVLYVPKVRRKLVSINAATESGHKGDIEADNY